MPIKPTVSMVKVELKELFFGKLPGAEYSDDQLVQLFENGKQYIGYEELLSSHSKKLKKDIQFTTQIMDLRIILIQKTLSLFQV